MLASGRFRDHSPSSRTVARWLTRFAVRASSVFHRISRTGFQIPGGPILLVANHNHMLLDPLLLMAITGRKLRPLVKSPHFETPGFSWVLRRIDAMPVYRRQDDPRQLARNRSALEEASAALRAGHALLVFPEGGSEPGPGLRPLKAGAARTALRAEDEAGWHLGIHVVPVGVACDRPERFRSQAVLNVGQPIGVADWRARYATEPALAVRELTEKIRHRLDEALREASDGIVSLRTSALQGRTNGIELSRWLAEAPLAALGSAAWCVPYAIAGLAPIIGRTEASTVSTVKLLSGIVAFPITYLAWLLVAGMAAGAVGVLLTAVALPWLGHLALGWHDRRRRIVARRRAEADGASEGMGVAG